MAIATIFQRNNHIGCSSAGFTSVTTNTTINKGWLFSFQPQK